MTLRFSVADGMTPHEKNLWHAQEGRCGLCLQPLSRIMARAAPARDNPTNLEHTWPQKLRNDFHFAAIRSGRPMFTGTKGNSTLAHHRCNVVKGNRAPTGCELIILAWVNARLGIKPNLRPSFRRLVPA